MNTIRTLGFAAVAALSLGVGAAMAQEAPNDGVDGSTTYYRNAAPQMQSHPAVQSGSSDIERPNSQWQPGNTFNNEGSQG